MSKSGLGTFLLVFIAHGKLRETFLSPFTYTNSSSLVQFLCTRDQEAPEAMQNIEFTAYIGLVQDTVRETAEEKLQADKLIETDRSTTSTQDVNLKIAQNRGKVLQ